MTAEKPVVSVVMSVFNDQKYLGQAVESILQQIFNDFEFIIIDDGSTDDTWSILQSYSDPRIRLIKNEQNIGLTRSLNRGLRTARGTYIARMDSDDIALPNRVASQIKVLENNPCLGLLGSNVSILFEATGKEKRKIFPQTDLEIKWQLLFGNSFYHSTMMFRHDLVDKFGYYDEAIPFAQDYEFFSRLAKNCEVSNLPQVLLVGRSHKKQISVQYVREQMANSARVSYRNLEQLLIQLGQNYEESVLKDAYALWSFHHPPLINETLEPVIYFIETLFPLFCEQYLCKSQTDIEYQWILRRLRKRFFARLYLQVSIRYFRQQNLSPAWKYFVKSFYLQPIMLNWSLGSRLFLKSLIGVKNFETLKEKTGSKIG